MIEYTELEPCEPLRPFIDAYWISAGMPVAGETSYILPDGCCDILINTGDALVSPEEQTLKKHGTYLIGASTRFTQVGYTGNISVCGIRFKPMGLMAFFSRLNVSDFKNDAVDFSLVSKINLDYIFDSRLTNTRLKHKLDNYFMNLLPRNYSPGNHAIIENALTIITRNKGVIKIEELACRVCTSHRNLERLFGKCIGLSPKEFSKITRLNNIRKDIRTCPGKTLEEIAFDYNYYDSSHFTKDFINYAGVAPSRYF